MTEDEAQRSRWTFYEVVIFILTYHGKSPLRIIIFYFSRLKYNKAISSPSKNAV
jgi:hypothetical protein